MRVERKMSDFTKKLTSNITIDSTPPRIEALDVLAK